MRPSRVSNRSPTKPPTTIQQTHSALHIIDTRNNNNKTPPKVISEERVATPHGRQCTRPLHVLAVQCPLQISPITQPRVRYNHSRGYATTIPRKFLHTSFHNSNLYLKPKSLILLTVFPLQLPASILQD